MRYCRPARSRWTKREVLSRDKARIAAKTAARRLKHKEAEARKRASKKPQSRKQKSRKPANPRFIPLTENELQVGVAKMKAAAKANREAIAATARLLKEAVELQHAKDKAEERVEEARQRQDDVQEAIEAAPVITSQLLAREDRAERAEERALQQLDDVVAETTEVLKEVAAAQKHIAPRRFEILEMTAIESSSGQIYALVKCLHTDTLQAYYRSSSGLLWHLARYDYPRHLVKSHAHYSGTMVASWPLQNLFNAAVAKEPPRVVSEEEHEQSVLYKIIERPVWQGDYAVKDLVFDNSCFEDPHDLFKRLQRAFPCPFRSLFVQYMALTLRSDVIAVVDELYGEPKATQIKEFLLDANLTTKQIYTFVRDALDAYMRKHFETAPNTGSIQVVSPFDTPFMKNASVVKRVIRSRKEPAARFNVFIVVYEIRNAPPQFLGRKLEQVILVQPKGYINEALEKLANSFGVLYCFTPAGQLTCKPLEYRQQVDGDRNPELLEYSGYIFVGEYLAGVFPAQQT